MHRKSWQPAARHNRRRGRGEPLPRPCQGGWINRSHAPVVAHGSAYESRKRGSPRKTGGCLVQVTGFRRVVLWLVAVADRLDVRVGEAAEGCQQDQAEGDGRQRVAPLPNSAPSGRSPRACRCRPRPTARPMPPRTRPPTRRLLGGLGNRIPRPTARRTERTDSASDSATDPSHRLLGGLGDGSQTDSATDPSTDCSADSATDSSARLCHRLSSDRRSSTGTRVARLGDRIRSTDCSGDSATDSLGPKQTWLRLNSPRGHVGRR